MITRVVLSEWERREDKDTDVLHLTVCGRKIDFLVDKEDNLKRIIADEQDALNVYIGNRLKQKDYSVILAWLIPCRTPEEVEKTLKDWVLN